MSFEKINFIPNQTEPTAEFMNNLQDEVIRIGKQGGSSSVEYEGVYKIPAIAIDYTALVGDKLYISELVEKGYINKRDIKFGDFIYWNSYPYPEYYVYQTKIEKMYDADGNAFTDFNSGYTYNDIDSIEISNYEIIYEEDVTYKPFPEDYVYEDCFWFSNNYVMSKTNTFIYLGDLPFELKEEQGSNTPISENVSVSGEDNVVGCRGFKILSCEQIDNTTGKYFLNSVEGLCVGDIYSAMFDAYSSDLACYIDAGEITSIDTNEKSVVVTNFKNETNDNPNDNILFIVSKPFLGTEDIGQLASASGVNNFALLMGASAEGKLTKAIAKFSKTRGLRCITKGHGSSADGAGLVATRNYQRVAGLYNIEDTEEKYLDIVGNGKNDRKRSNAYTLDEKGNGWYAGGLEAVYIKARTSVDTEKVNTKNIVVTDKINNIKLNYNDYIHPVEEITFKGNYVLTPQDIESPILNGTVSLLGSLNLNIKELKDITLRSVQTDICDTLKIKEGKIYHEKRILELDLTGLEWGLSTTNIYILKLNNILGEKWDKYGKKCLREGYAIASFGDYIGKWAGDNDIFSNNSEFVIQQSSSGIYLRMYYVDENVTDMDTFNQYLRNLEASGNTMKLYVVLNDDLVETTEIDSGYSEAIQMCFNNPVSQEAYIDSDDWSSLLKGNVTFQVNIDLIEEVINLKEDTNKKIKYISNNKDLIDYDKCYNYGVYHLAGTEFELDEESLREILVNGADYDEKSPSFGSCTQTRISNGKILYRDETDAPDDSYYGKWRELYARAADVDKRIKYIYYDKTDTYVDEAGDLRFNGVDIDKITEPGLYYVVDNRGEALGDYMESDSLMLLLVQDDRIFGDITQTKILGGRIFVRSWSVGVWEEWQQVYSADTKYNPNSYKAQSGKAVAEAIADVNKRIKYIDYTSDKYAKEDEWGDIVYPTQPKYDELTEVGMYHITCSINEWDYMPRTILLLVDDDGDIYQTRIENGRIFQRNDGEVDEDGIPCWSKWEENYITKTTLVTYESGYNNCILYHNFEQRFGERLSLILSMPYTIDERYESYFTFISGEIPTSLNYSATPIRWSGDDVDYEGVFIPEANKIYEVAVKYLGDDAEGNPIISARVGVV